MTTAPHTDLELQKIDELAHELTTRVFEYCESHFSARTQNPPTLQALEQSAIGLRAAARSFVILGHECACELARDRAPQEVEACEK